jgi:GDP/UDP-N,N'-diacetylbacillosamine 2-epimerase (hydrolysing)
MERSAMINNKRKIAVITGTRAEYGLLYWVLKRLKEEEGITLQLLVTGMHLSPEFGLTYKQIEADGFNIDRKLDILLSGDTPAAITKSMGLATIAFGQAYAELQPDLILVLGDRFEIFSAVSAALIARIPVAHCHGGELTAGAVDDALRHAITKMSHLHFTATEEYKRRVVQLGENSELVFNVGGVGIEAINRNQPMERAALEQSLDFKLHDRNLLITFHPVTLEKESAEKQFSELLAALDEMKDFGLIFTLPNADTDGRVIITLINSFVKRNAERAKAFASLGHVRYLSALRYVDAVVGNSSSGLIEAPSFKLATVNIGDRQKGRIKAASVIDCLPEKQSIVDAIKKACSEQFREKLQSVENPYGSGNASEKIVSVLKSVKLDKLVHKEFSDIPVK